jgi:hypothetical protein
VAAGVDFLERLDGLDGRECSVEFYAALKSELFQQLGPITLFRDGTCRSLELCSRSY